MPDVLDRCVKKVKKKNKGKPKGKKVSPWAVCSKSTGYVKKKGGGWRKKKK